ncbi:MAG: hypothetical protein IKB01_07465 [Lachnospiraceae bacterium]|nr:hypothetical protein [Lachnospiraceae bacterium]
MGSFANYSCDGQMSIFDFLSSDSKEIAGYEPYEDFAKIGSLFTNGKERIRDFFLKCADEKERITFLKREYGIGGFGSPIKKPCYIHSSMTDAKGSKVEFYDENMQNKTAYITFPLLSKVISKLINENNY